MAIKVVIPENTTNIQVGGLYQWDFGQALEIGSEIMEVHFACSGMTEAIVRECNFSADTDTGTVTGTVTIPDKCLEQASPITAWIYRISDTQGHTVKTITLPVIARTRPSASRDVPTEYVDKYAEALAKINEAVKNLANGTVVSAEATHAVSADNATKAGSATSASYSTSAGHAVNATTAFKLRISKDVPTVSLDVQEYGTYEARWAIDSLDPLFKEGVYFAILTLDGMSENVYSSYSGVGYIHPSAVGEWRTFEIAVGDKFISIEDNQSGSEYDPTVKIHINTRGDKGGVELGASGTLIIYPIATFWHEKG